MAKYFVTIFNNHTNYKTSMKDIQKVYKHKKRILPEIPQFENSKKCLTDDVLTNSGDSEL
jgi:hypothetical protein